MSALKRSFRRIYVWLRSRLAGRTKVQATLYYASSSIICQILRFTAVLIATRRIEPAQFGLFAEASLTLSLSGIAREIGQSLAFLRYQGNDRRYSIFNFQLNLGLGLVAGLLLTVALKYVPGIQPAIKHAAFVIAAIAIADSLSLTGLLTAQKRLQFRSLGVVDITAVSVYLSALTIASTRMSGFKTLLLAQMMESSVRLVMLLMMNGRIYVGWTSGRDLWDYYMKEYVKVYIFQIWFQALATRIDYLLMTSLSNVYQLGIYERTSQFVRIPWSLSINLMDKVLMASYSNEAGNLNALRKVHRKATYAIAAGVTGAVIAVALGMLLFLRILVGSEWAAIIEHLWWIAIPYTLATPFIWNNNLLFQGVREPKQTFVVLIIAFSVQIGVGLILVPKYNAAGMFVTMAIGQFLCLGYQCRSAGDYFRSRSAIAPTSAS